MIKTFKYHQYTIVWSGRTKGKFINRIEGEELLPEEERYQSITIWKDDVLIGYWIPEFRK